MQNERVVVRRAGRSAIREFLGAHNCFSIIRTSGKVVVFDTRIPIQLAFYALVEHGALPGAGLTFDAVGSLSSAYPPRFIFLVSWPRYLD
jgi:hypothetical protein